MADTRDSTSAWGGLIEMPQHQVIQVVLFGIGLGIVTWILGMIVKQIIIVPLFCGDPLSSTCVDAPEVAMNVASVIAAFIGLLGLVRLSVYRPLLIVLSVLISLWGIGNWTMGLHWYEAVTWFIMLYTLAYLAFAWLVRPRAFAPTAVLLIIAVVAIRFLPML